MVNICRYDDRLPRIISVRMILPKPDIENFRGTEAELAVAIDKYYANTW